MGYPEWSGRVEQEVLGRLREENTRLRAERDALQAQLDSKHAALEQSALSAWAEWIESGSAHFPGITVEQIVVALRSGREPFGAMRGDGR